jgi:hypothetical protein
VFVLCVYFTRPALQRILASIAGAMVFMVGNILFGYIGKVSGLVGVSANGRPSLRSSHLVRGCGSRHCGDKPRWMAYTSTFRHSWAHLVCGDLRAFRAVVRLALVENGRAASHHVRHGVMPWIADYAACFMLMTSAMAVHLAIAHESKSPE